MNNSHFTEEILEGKSKIFVFKCKQTNKGPSAKEKVPFYNTSMELNRDLSVVFCQWLVNSSKSKLNLCDGLAASGIRGIRIANEVEGSFYVTINDWNKAAFNLINKNIKENKLINVESKNNNLNTLLSEKRFDYIDIDPFGSPIYFIDSAIRSIKSYGIIACTATDTATLCGTYPSVCFRRYSANPFHSTVMKEVGLRILLGSICKEACKYDKGIKPILSFSTDHYFRTYIQIIKGIDRANESVKNYTIIKPGMINASEINNEEIGPLWIGKLSSKREIGEFRTILFEKKLNTKNSIWKLLDTLEEEADSPLFFYTTNKLASILKKSPPKIKTLFNNLKNKGYFVSKTHFYDNGFKTDAPRTEIEKMFK
jgi:tRNA (guanine26-N2/guanine27-N2)-dimethyltransferase